MISTFLRMWLRGALLALLCVTCQGANVCIRDGGTGDGSAWDNALDDLPSTLTRGNTYYVADGSYAGYTFDDAESSTTVITVKKATVADHGTSTGWQDTYGDGTATFNGSLIFARDYFEIDGATRDENDWTSQVYGFRVVGRCVSWPINYAPGGDHLTFRYLDVGGTVGSSYPSIQDEPFYLVNNSGTSFDFTISRCFVHNCTLVQLAGIDGVTIEYTHFADMWAKECIRGQGEAKNGIIRYCKFKDTTRDTGLPGEAGTAPIAIWDGGAGNFDNWQIYGNVFWDTATREHSGGCILVGGDGAGWDGSPASNVKIYNNTIVGFLGNFTANILINGGTGNEVRNNLWYNCIGTPDASPDTSSNGEVASDPFVSLATGNFRLSAGIAGTSISSPYNADLTGATRGADGTFDRGAFEYGAGVPTNRALQRKGRSMAGGL